MSNEEFTQLSLIGKAPSVSDDLTNEDLALVMSCAIEDVVKLAKEKREELASDFRKVRGILFDTGVNDHGFAMSAEALKYMVDHFNRSKDTPYLHNFYKNHDFHDVDAMLGRMTSLTFDTKTNQMMYEALLSNKHPLVQRAELMKSVSGTIIRGALECSSCGDPYSGRYYPEPSCEHVPNGKDIYPVTHKAIHIETSFVTFPAYKNTSVEMFNSFNAKMVKMFGDVVEQEFPDLLGVITERSEELSRLQAEGLTTTPTEEELKLKAAQEEEKENLNSLMANMGNLAVMLEEGFKMLERTSGS